MLISGVYNFNDWKTKFVKYIEDNGNKPSVAKDYARRIEKILEEENIPIETLYCDIDQWIAEYKTGSYASVNKAKHYAPSSALIKFKAFAPTLLEPYAPKQTDILKERYPADLIY